MKISNQAIKWFDIILKLEPGESLQVPVPDKKGQKRLEKEFMVLRERYSIVDEAFASQLSFVRTFHDKASWIKVTRSLIPTNVGVLIHANGKKEKIKLTE